MRMLRAADERKREAAGVAERLRHLGARWRCHGCRAANHTDLHRHLRREYVNREMADMQ